MKGINWTQLADAVKEIYPNIIQILSYGKNRWMVIFETEPDNFLTFCEPLVHLCKKHRVNIPLIMSRYFFATSQDSYPLEFLNICTSYTDLYSRENLLDGLSLKKRDIRLQIERELKSKLLLTRLLALESKSARGRFYKLLKESFQSLLPSFKGFLYLGGSPVPKNDEALLNDLEDIFHNDIKVIRMLHKFNKTPSQTLINTLFYEYDRFLRNAMEIIDKWEVND